MNDQPRELSATEVEIANALTGAGWSAHRCMDAWTAFEKDGRSITINWTPAGEIDDIEGITAATLTACTATMTATPGRSPSRRSDGHRY